MHNWIQRDLTDDEFCFIKSSSLGWIGHFENNNWENKIVICINCSCKLFITKHKLFYKDKIYIYEFFVTNFIVNRHIIFNDSNNELIINTILSCNELIIKNIIE